MNTSKIVRALALGVIALCIVIFVWSLVLFPASADINLDYVRPQNSWTDTTLRGAITEAGFTVASLAYFLLAVQLFTSFFYLLVAGIIFVRRSSDWFSLYLCVLFVVFATMANSLSNLVGNLHPVLGFLVSGLGNGGWVGLFPIFYLFPDGKFVPHWTRWMMAVWAGFIVLLLLGTSGLTKGLNDTVPDGLFNMIGIPLVLLIFLVGVGSQVYRYFRHSNAIQRQQTKWVLSAIIFFVASIVFSLINVGLVQSGQHYTANDLRVGIGFVILFGVVSTFFPISIGIAILRYRLWDIDVFIRRTLTYALITALLVIVFFGSVVLLQQLFSGITGSGQNELVTVLSTLAIAALFVPVRNRVQNEIDKRFNRNRYNTQEVLADFANTVRDETDLEKLTGRLMQVVDETMQPKTVSVWLKKTTEYTGTESWL